MIANASDLLLNGMSVVLVQGVEPVGDPVFLKFRPQFDSLDEVERAVIDPSGAIFFSGRRPTSDMTRHSEILDRLERLSAQVAQLRS